MIQGLINIAIFSTGGIVGIAYVCFAIGDFYDKKQKMSYVKGFFACILGAMTFYFLLAVLGLAIDQVAKPNDNLILTQIQ